MNFAGEHCVHMINLSEITSAKISYPTGPRAPEIQVDVHFCSGRIVTLNHGSAFMFIETVKQLKSPWFFICDSAIINMKSVEYAKAAGPGPEPINVYFGKTKMISLSVSEGNEFRTAWLKLSLKTDYSECR